MRGKRERAEVVIPLLRKMEVLLGQGQTVKQAARKAGITAPTYYRWRKKYGGLKLDQAKVFKGLERENSRLKKIVADLSLDNAILREAASGNF